ncbi:GNAT family protein [Mycoplasmatota bacterium WC44]
MVKLNFSPFPSLETDNLILRQLEIKDAQAIFDYQSNKKNFKYVDMKIYTNIKEAQNYILKMNNGVEMNKWIIWAIADLRTNVILGTISIWNISHEQQKGELGYGLFPGNTGKGIMSEALKKVVEYGFYNIGLNTLEAYTNILNNRSITVLERNDFTRKTLFTEINTTSGKPMDMVIYKRNIK